MASFIALTEEKWAQIRYEYEHGNKPVADICAEHGFSAGTLRDRVRRWGWKRRWTGPVPREGPPPRAVPRLSETAPCAGFTSPRLRGEVDATSHNEGASGEGEPQRAQDAVSPPHPNPLPASGEREPPWPPPEIPPYGTGPGFPPRQDFADADDPATIVPRLQGAVARVLPAIETILSKLAAGPIHPRELEQSARALGALTRTLRELGGLLEQHTSAGWHSSGPAPDTDELEASLARKLEAIIEGEREERPRRYLAGWEEFAAEAEAMGPQAAQPGW